jgi:predicted NUDIX family NTP pyrophosphohydrolase
VPERARRLVWNSSAAAWRLRALRKAGSAEVYLAPAALLCCFERSLLRNQRRRVCSAVARLSIAVQNGSDMAALKTTSRRSTTSAGILAYRKGARGLEVLLVHPGGPFWRKKDAGAWSIPKGEIDAADAPEQVARREFAEELGPSASIGPLRPLGEIRQRGGKRVIAFAGEGHFDPAALISNTFDIEWPPRTGRRQSFPEVDRAEWFDIELARTKMLSAQVELLDRLSAMAAESNIE